MSDINRRCRLPAIVLVAAVLVGLLAPPRASAQVHVSMGPAGGAPDLGPATLTRYSRILQLDEAQSTAAQHLFDAYLASRRSNAETLRSKLLAARTAANDQEPAAAIGQTHQIIAAHSEDSARLTNDFLRDLKSLLTGDQVAAQWPALERYRRRAQWLRLGPISGSAVDLVTVVERLEFAPDHAAALSETLQQYELEIDRLLVARESVEADARAGAAGPPDTAPLGLPGFDPERFAALEKRDRDHARKVREVNQRYARLLGSLLPEDQRTRLAEAFQAASFRSIYKTSFAQRSIDAALAMKDLTPEQRHSLQALAADYARDLQAANRRWAEAQERAEADGRAHGFPIMTFEPGAEQPPAELADARKSRRELDAAVRRHLAGLLTEDQRDRLPKPATARRSGPGATGQRIAVFAGDDGAGGVLVMSDDDAVLPIDMDVDVEEDVKDSEDGVIVRQVIIHRSDEPQTSRPEDRPAEPRKEP